MMTFFRVRNVDLDAAQSRFRALMRTHVTDTDNLFPRCDGVRRRDMSD